MKYILLHGLGQTSSSWNDTIEVMEKKSDILCPNLSDLLRDEEVNYSNLYKVFSEYCMNFTEPLNICGLSLGGILTLQYGIENPNKINSMVLIGTQYVMPKGLLKLQNVVFHIMPNSTFKKMGFGKKDFINLSKSMMNLDFRQNLQNISCPVLVICGEKDNVNKRASLQLKEQIPHAEISIIENAGHEVNLDAPKKLGVILNTFFK
ncbi:alpha/beta fold hydrolase [Sporolactobacillus sp. Y61]|uniref:Alpha/beta fold hydrolase n=1 Tax=Sporolactobacillus sp. Y61 TaxID=3160863 RepID=A0AAU8IG07_9BACL